MTTYTISSNHNSIASHLHGVVYSTRAAALRELSAVIGDYVTEQTDDTIYLYNSREAAESDPTGGDCLASIVVEVQS